MWEAIPQIADRFLMQQRKELGLARATVVRKAQTPAGFYDFLIFRYQGDVRALTGHVGGSADRRVQPAVWSRKA